jgi:hypothetical protein
MIKSNNIGKFGNITLPGGGQFNYSDIMSKAEADKEILRKYVIGGYRS